MKIDIPGPEQLEDIKNVIMDVLYSVIMTNTELAKIADMMERQMDGRANNENSD